MHKNLRIRVIALTLLSSLAAIAIILLNDGTANAVSTRSFLLDDAEALAAGTLEGTSVHSDGSVTRGAQADRIELPNTPVAYALAEDAHGSIYLGTGNNGTIFRVEGNQVEVFAETGQLLVTSLVFDNHGMLYAGTLPEGRIYRIDPQGQTTEFARPPDTEHIWDLAWDASQHRLYAATGPEGRIYAIDTTHTDGQSQVYFDSEASHIMSLALDDDGTLYAGTSDQALVLRIRSSQDSEVVFDFPGNEITDLSVHHGVVAVAANEFPDPPAVTPTKISQTSTARPARPAPGKGHLYRVGGDGRTELLLSNDKSPFTCVQLMEDGTIFVGAGANGRIYRVATDRTSSTWIDVDERQVLALDLSTSPVFATGDTGALYRVRPNASHAHSQANQESSQWTSKALDSGFRSSFGRLTWRATGTLSFQTRTGNTEEPDDSWSSWSTPMQSPGPVRSPSSRFLQIRASFDADAHAILRAVQAFYLPQNQRAVIHDVGIKAPSHEASKNRPPDEPPEASATYPLHWEVENPDSDRMRYRLRFRREDQSQWRPMFEDSVHLTENEFAWDTSGVPDGWYMVQVEGSDELANPEALTLQTTATSEPLRIDNHPPNITNLAFHHGTIRGRAIDSLGPIIKLDYAIDGAPWRLFFPTDNLFDARDESFALDLSDAIDSGSHIVAIRAFDAGGNVTTAELTTR